MSWRWISRTSESISRGAGVGSTAILGTLAPWARTTAACASNSAGRGPCGHPVAYDNTQRQIAAPASTSRWARTRSNALNQFMAAARSARIDVAGALALSYRIERGLVRRTAAAAIEHGTLLNGKRHVMDIPLHLG